MGLSQSMVSRKLSAFEATTGITAVDRSSRPVKTDTGRKDAS